MNHLDISALSRRGLLLEGASIPCQAGLCRGRKKEALMAGVGVLYCGERVIEFERMPILGGRQSRPRFICPAGCRAGAYKLYPHGEWFACQRCSGYVRPSRFERRDPRAALMRRLEKARAALGVSELLGDPPPLRPGRGPRARWLRNRKIIALRLAELRLAEALGVPVSDFLRRDEPPSPQ